MAQSKRVSSNIDISMCKIKKQVAGNLLVTTGSACVLRWPWEIEFASSEAQGKNRAFVVTTSQVFSQRDSNSKTAWRADFQPLKWSIGKDKFSLNGVAVYEVPIPSQNHAITLTFIPTETLHNQKIFSKLRTDQLKVSRSQLCHREDKTYNEEEFEAADKKQRLCFVISETAMEEDKFILHCYQLCRDGSGSYFLQDHGNKAEIRTLKDFQSSEKPKGSVILNESGDPVGLLAFGDKDEILPLFFAQITQGDHPATHVESNTDNSNKDSGLSPSQECSGSDGLETQSDGPENDSDAGINKNQYNEKQPPSLNNGLKRHNELEASGEYSRHSATSSGDQETGSKSDPDPDSGGLKKDELKQRHWKKHQPQESSYYSVMEQTMQGNGNNGKEEIRSSEEELQPSVQPQAPGGTASGKRELPDGSAAFTRSYSVAPSMTPRSQRKLLAYRSVFPAIPLKSDTLIKTAILPTVYVMDVISRYLDMSCRGIQNWRHLASLTGVSEYVLLKCQTGEQQSRSEKMFDLLSTTDPDLLIGTLKQHLRDLNINNVELYLQGLNLRDDEKVVDFLESSDLNIPGRVLIMLDLIPEETWRNLGVNLGVDRKKLKQIKIDCANQHENPAGHVINMIYRSQPTMPITQLKKRLTDIERNDVAKKLDKLSGKGTIHDLFEDLDLMRDVTSMLNGADNAQIKNYKDLADICDIPSDVYQSLQPPSVDSPTNEVLNDIVTSKPRFTVEDLFTNLCDMKRVDVIEAISPYFVEEDMRNMKRKLKISYE